MWSSRQRYEWKCYKSVTAGDGEEWRRTSVVVEGTRRWVEIGRDGSGRRFELSPAKVCHGERLEVRTFIDDVFGALFDGAGVKGFTVEGNGEGEAIC